jgi:hypothetical protein
MPVPPEWAPPRWAPLTKFTKVPTLDRHNGLFGPVDRTCSLVPLFRPWVGITPNRAAGR